MWVIEEGKGSMEMLVVFVAGVAVNVVGAGGSAEMNERAIPMQHGQQAVRLLL